MADINKGDIKLMASEVLFDTPDGGGQMTSTEIVSGNVNQLFGHISRLDNTEGNVSMRKAYVSVQTETRAMYYGAHVALVEQAADPLVNITMFTTKDWFDTRESCQKRIEGYLVKGPMYPCGLWGDHYAGTRQIQLFVEPKWEIPEVGDVIVLIAKTDLNGSPVPDREQFVRITDIEAEIKELQYAGSDAIYEKKILKISFSDKLEFDLKGDAPSRLFKYESSAGTVVHSTVAADTATYYGVGRLVENADSGSFQVVADGVRKQIVPSAQTQSSITDFGVGVTRPAIFSTSSKRLSKTLNLSSETTIFKMVFPFTPGTVEFKTGSTTYTDNEKGDLLDSSKTAVGVVNHASGTVTFNSSPYTGSGSGTLSAIPAIEYETPTETGSIHIVESNRGFVYVFSCYPVPKKGTLRVDYMSAGKWYSLYDQGNGQIKGLSSDLGSGTINFDTGSVSLTLAGLPDINTDILLYWGVPVTLKQLGDYAYSKVTLTLSEKAERGSIEITVPALSDTYRIYDMEDGTLVAEDGPLSRTIGSYSAEDMELRFHDEKFNIPDHTTFHVNYSVHKYTGYPNYIDAEPEGYVDGDYFFFQVLSTPVKPHTFSCSKMAVVDESLLSEEIEVVFRYKRFILYMKDNGNGKIILHEKEVGEIDYSTGQCFIKKNYMSNTPFSRCEYEEVTRNGKFWRLKRIVETGNKMDFQFKLFDGIIATRFIVSSGDDPEPGPDAEPRSEDITASPVTFVNKPESTTLIAGSVFFEIGDALYFDDGLGSLKDSSTGEILFTVNYSTGKLTPKSLSSPLTTGITNMGGLLKKAESRIYCWTFRTPGAPVTPGSFTVRATQDNGTTLTATAATTGEILSDYIYGNIDFTTGIVSLFFGQWLQIDQHTGESWLNGAPVNEEGTHAFKYIDEGVQPSTIIMNCVVQTYVPLDASLVGLNPVKLPIDGKVPVFRDGNIILIHNSQTTVVNSPSAGQTITLPRTDVDLIELYDNNGVFVPELGNYSVNLPSGTLTFENPLNLSGYTPPFQILNRVEDMVIATDVQITGHITVSQPLKHSYNANDPASPTYVSSILPIGNMQARVHNEFSQNSWSGIWSDSPTHSNTTAQYDFVNYPVIVTNQNAVKERFAFIFKSTSTVDVVGEHLGVILSNASIYNDIMPVNPATSQPYFRIRHEGWGSGWNAGEVLRINIDAANFPVWFIKTVQQGPPTETDDHYTTQIRGDSA